MKNRINTLLSPEYLKLYILTSLSVISYIIIIILAKLYDDIIYVQIIYFSLLITGLLSAFIYNCVQIENIDIGKEYFVSYKQFFFFILLSLFIPVLGFSLLIIFRWGLSRSHKKVELRNFIIYVLVMGFTTLFTYFLIPIIYKGTFISFTSIAILLALIISKNNEIWLPRIDNIMGSIRTLISRFSFDIAHFIIPFILIFLINLISTHERSDALLGIATLGLTGIINHILEGRYITNRSSNISKYMIIIIISLLITYLMCWLILNNGNPTVITLICFIGTMNFISGYQNAMIRLSLEPKIIFNFSLGIVLLFLFTVFIYIKLSSHTIITYFSYYLFWQFIISITNFLTLSYFSRNDYSS